MTIREELVRARRRCLALMLGGTVAWGALVLSIAMLSSNGSPPWIFQAAVPLFAAVLLGVLGINFLVRRPKCNGNLR